MSSLETGQVFVSLFLHVGNSTVPRCMHHSRRLKFCQNHVLTRRYSIVLLQKASLLYIYMFVLLRRLNIHYCVFSISFLNLSPSHKETFKCLKNVNALQRLTFYKF
jgi:hypothetical protein